MSAQRGAAVLAEFVRRGTLGTDPEILTDLIDLCRLAGVDPMPATDDAPTECPPSGPAVDFAAARADCERARQLLDAIGLVDGEVPHLGQARFDANAPYVLAAVLGHCEGLLALCERVESVNLRSVLKYTDKQKRLADEYAGEADRLEAERDRLAAELSRTQSALAEYETRVAADRAEYLRRVRELEAEVRRLRGDPLDMAALLELPPNAVPPGSRSGEAVAWREQQRAKRGAA